MYLCIYVLYVSISCIHCIHVPSNKRTPLPIHLITNATSIYLYTRVFMCLYTIYIAYTYRRKSARHFPYTYFPCTSKHTTHLYICILMYLCICIPYTLHTRTVEKAHATFNTSTFNTHHNIHHIHTSIYSCIYVSISYAHCALHIAHTYRRISARHVSYTPTNPLASVLKTSFPSPVCVCVCVCVGVCLCVCVRARV